MSRRSIRAFCLRCHHQQPFVRAHFDWKLHVSMTVLTLGIWIVVLISSLLKHLHWPWRCEHCGWHEPDFRSAEERSAQAATPLSLSKNPVSRSRREVTPSDFKPPAGPSA